MIVFFPTYARRTPTGWTATIAGMVSRPLPEKSRRRVLAVAVLRRLLDLDEEQLITWCGDHLARYKCPNKVLFVDQLPRNLSGKLLRRELV